MMTSSYPKDVLTTVGNANGKDRTWNVSIPSNNTKSTIKHTFTVELLDSKLQPTGVKKAITIEIAPVGSTAQQNPSSVSQAITTQEYANNATYDSQILQTFAGQFYNPNVTLLSGGKGVYTGYKSDYIFTGETLIEKNDKGKSVTLQNYYVMTACHEQGLYGKYTIQSEYRMPKNSSISRTFYVWYKGKDNNAKLLDVSTSDWNNGTATINFGINSGFFSSSVFGWLAGTPWIHSSTNPNDYEIWAGLRSGPLPNNMPADYFNSSAVKLGSLKSCG